MAQGFMAWIQPTEGGGHPDQGLPGGGGRVDPGYGRPGGGPVDPGWGIPGGRPPHISGGPARPGFSPGHPDNTLPGGGEEPPVWPIDPDRPSHGLPPVPGHPLPPTDPPPGTIWPPLPPELNLPPGKAIVLVLISGVGYRYAVIEIEPGHPDNTLPDEGEGGEEPHPQPPRPGAGLPQPPGRPPTAGQPLPQPPVRPGQPLPPTAQPKPAGRR